MTEGERKTARRRKKIAPVLITLLVIAYYALYFGLLGHILGGVWKIPLGILPGVVAVGMISVCIQRIREIEGGEEDDLSQY